MKHFTPRCPTANNGGTDHRYTAGPVPDQATASWQDEAGQHHLTMHRKPGEGAGWVGRRLRKLGIDPLDETRCLVTV